MDHFRLIFRTGDNYGRMGDSWIEVCLNRNGPENQPVITHGGCSPAGLEHQIAALKAELDAICGKREPSPRSTCAPKWRRTRNSDRCPEAPKARSARRRD